MAISIKIVMATMISLAAIIAAVVAFVPTFIAGNDSITDTVQNVRESSVARIRSGINEFFVAPTNYGLAYLMENNAAGTFGMLSGTDEQKWNFACGPPLNIPGVGTGVIRFFSADPTVDVLWNCDIRNDSPDRDFYTLSRTNGTNLCFFKKFKTNGSITSSPYECRPYRDPPAQTQLATMLSMARRMRWVPPFYGYDRIQFSLFVGIRAPSSAPAAIILNVFPMTLQTLLTGLGLRSRSRAFISDGTSNYVIGVSWDEALQTRLPGFLNFSLPLSQRAILKTPDTLADELIRSALPTVGGEGGLRNLTGAVSTTIDGPDGDTFFDAEVVRDSYGIDLRFVVAIPQKDYLEDVMKKRDSTLGGVAAAVVAMIILAVILAIVLARPLDELGHRMYLTASLQDDNEDVKKSMMSEIADMQEAYEIMKRELFRMKAYLPQSLIQNADEDEEIDEGDVASSAAGSSAVARSRESSVNDDARSSRSQSSRATSRKGVLAGGCLKMSRELTQKRVAVVAFNLVGFGNAIQAKGQASASSVSQSIQKTQLDVVQAKAGANRGVVDVFQGDHVFVTFNAVNNCASPGKRAAACALEVCKALAQDPNMPRVTAGIAFSSAIVGNMGTDGLMRFNVIGPCYGDANAMERLARSRVDLPNADGNTRPWCIMMSQDLHMDVSAEYTFESVDVVRCAKGPKIASVLHGAKSMAEDEWMYQLEEARKGDLYAAANDAFTSLLDKNNDAVREQLANIKSEQIRARVEEILNASSIREAATSISIYSNPNV